MSTPKLVYVTKIRTTPAKLWEALTNADFIEQYWFGCRNTSTWKEGDPIESRDPDGTLSWKGTILKSVPESEVIFTFDHLVEEPPSRVTFKIDPLGAGEVQLTVTHDEFQEVSPIRDRVSNGWPSIVEGVKNLLETGAAELKAGCGAK
ncbi:SRPBCC family protein [Luteolibacter sp. GHJ8]|uniref:SRPBCC family protein n=1 Tax=Luteolibacter rhizosphaerae TaxID=2989719 RepID=A0ABT3GBP6_9BACT|nr:SRPBCC family protein [Luteolibacter rhizosphaerae]MCW1916921.1 SRPBCC family protein [Luteolibacter rhizosphaerae]